jgi:hypothetical protein
MVKKLEVSERDWVFFSIGMIVGFLLNLSIAHGHEWYDPECCGGGDCKPVACEELQEGEAHGRAIIRWGEHKFEGSQIRPSKDAKCHVCVHDFKGLTGERAMCVYVQQGT